MSPGAYTLPAVDGLESLEPQEPITTARIQPSQFSRPESFYQPEAPQYGETGSTGAVAGFAAPYGVSAPPAPSPGPLARIGSSLSNIGQGALSGLTYAERNTRIPYVTPFIENQVRPLASAAFNASPVGSAIELQRRGLGELGINTPNAGNLVASQIPATGLDIGLAAAPFAGKAVKAGASAFREGEAGVLVRNWLREASAEGGYLKFPGENNPVQPEDIIGHSSSSPDLFPGEPAHRILSNSLVAEIRSLPAEQTSVVHGVPLWKRADGKVLLETVSGRKVMEMEEAAAEILRRSALHSTESDATQILVQQRQRVQGFDTDALRQRLRAGQHGAGEVQDRLDIGKNPFDPTALPDSASTRRQLQAVLLNHLEEVQTMGEELARRTNGAEGIPARIKSAIEHLLTSEEGGIRNPFGREPVPPAQTFEQGAPIPEHESIPPIQKLTQAIQNAGKATPEQRAMFAQQRAQQAGRGAGALERGIAQGQGQGAFQAAKGAMAGEFERPSFQVPAFTPEDAHGLYQTIGAADNVRYFDKVNASEALTDLLGGRIPQPAQLDSLQKVFPKEAENLFRAVQQKKGIDWWKEFTGAAGAPQVLQTLGDLSATLRQGMVLGWSHPLNWLKAVGAQVRAVQSEEVGNATRQGIENDAMFTRSDGLGFKDVGGHIYGGERYAPGTERAGGFAGLNESRVSQAIQKAPVLGPVTRASERAFDTLLNAQGFGVYKQVASDMLEHGVTDPLRFEKVAQVVNHARGYGSFAPGKIAEGLNALYSGRNFLSRFEVLIDPFRYWKYPEARNLAAKNLAGFITANMTLLGFLAETGSVSGLWSVNFDPRSADWGKVKIGNARIDPWAGFGPIVRLAARLATGETQNQKGETQPIHPDQEILRFFQNKESPAANIIASKLLGQNEFPGEEKGFDAKTAANLFTPLLVQDVVDAIQKQGGLAPVAVGAGSFFGLGAQTYNPSNSIQRDQAAQEMGLADYESATKEQRKQINDKLGIKTGIANIAQVGNIEAADQALKKFPGAAGDSYVKYKNFYRDLNESEQSKQAWQDSKDLIAKYEAVTSPERLDQVAQTKYKKPFSQLTPGQQNAVTGDIHSAYREQRPELDAWLAYWGANDSVKTQEAGQRYEELLKKYTKTGKGPAVKLSK